MQARIAVGELPFVDHEPGVRTARGDLVEDQVERQLADTDVLAEREPQDEVRGRQPARDHDLELAQRREPERLARHHDRPVAQAERGAVGQQQVAIGDVRVRAHRDRADLEPAFGRPVVQRLDVRDDLLELEPAHVHSPGLDRPEHERIVGVRAVSDPDPHERHATGAATLGP